MDNLKEKILGYLNEDGTQYEEVSSEIEYCIKNGYNISIQKNNIERLLPSYDVEIIQNKLQRYLYDAIEVKIDCEFSNININIITSKNFL